MSFEKYKQIYHEFSEDADFINKTIKKLNFDIESKILDIGTGIGAMSTLLALNGFNILTGEPKEDQDKIGWNLNDGNIHYKEHERHFWNDWKESAKILGVRDKIIFQNFNAEKLPFADKSFDGIFLYDSIQHIKRREIALSECIRVLNYEGIIVVIEWTEKAIEDDYKKFGYKIEFVDPRLYINEEDFSVDVFEGEIVKIYIIRKK